MVKSEAADHSYSVVGSDGDSIPDSPLSCTQEPPELDYNPGPMTSISIKEEPMDSSNMLNELFSTTGNLKEEPTETILFTNIRPKNVPIQRLVYPKVSLKVESPNEECKDTGVAIHKSRSPNLTATVIRSSHNTLHPKIIFGNQVQASNPVVSQSTTSTRHPIQTALISSQPVRFSEKRQHQIVPLLFLFWHLTLKFEL